MPSQHVFIDSTMFLFCFNISGLCLSGAKTCMSSVLGDLAADPSGIVTKDIKGQTLMVSCR